DEAGNTAAVASSQTTSFVIDNTAPSVVIAYQEVTDAVAPATTTAPTSGYLSTLASPVRGAKSVAIQVTATEAGGGATLTGSPTVTVTETGASSATTVTLTESASGSKIWRGVYDVPSSGSDGTATVALTVSGISDEAGNTAAVASSQTTSFIIDNTTPSVTLAYTDGQTPYATGPYKSGNSVTVTATFTETNALSGTPTLTLVAGTFTGGTLPTVTLSGSGLVYTGTFTVPAGNGTVTASVGAVDTAGNTLTATGQTGFTIDNTAPTAALTYALDATNFASSLSRPAKSGDTVTVKATFTEAIALDGTPTITLTQDGNATVPSANTAMTSTASALVWTYSYVVQASQNATISASVATVDTAGNTLSTTAATAFVVDNAAITLGTLTMTTNDPGADGIINTLTPAFSLSTASDTAYTGTGVPTAAVASVVLQVSSDGGTNWTDNATFTGSGPYIVTASPALTTDTTYAIRAIATDLAGNTSTANLSTTNARITVDTTDPASGTLTMTTSDPGADGIVGTLTPAFSLATASDTAYTGTNAPTAAVASVAIQVSSDGGTTWTTKGTSASSSAPYTATLAGLTSGTTYSIRALVTDTAGNTATSALSTTNGKITVDTTAPTVGTLTMTTPDDGSADNDGIIGTLTPAFSLASASDTAYTGTGAATAGIASVVLQVSTNGSTWTDNATFTAPTSPATAYTVTASPALSTNGTYSIRALVTDTAGITSTAALSTTNGRITVDTTAPTAGTLTMTSTDTGSSGSDGIINTTTPAFSLAASGTADTAYTGSNAPTAAIASVVLQVSTDGSTWTDNATFTGSGPYTVTAAALTTNTTYSVRAKVFDLAGKSVTTALSTSSGSLTIDTTVPSTAGTIAVSETDGTSGDGVVKTATPAFTVTSPADSGYTAAAIWKVQLQVASGTGQTSGFANTGSAVTSATSGVYTLTTGTLAAGTYTIRAVATDVAGNETITGSTVDIAVDLTAPTAGTVAVTDTYGSSTTDAIVRSGTPAFTVTGASDTDTYTVPGTAAVASVQLQVASGSSQTTGFASTGSAVTSATGGVYTLAPTLLSDGTYTIRALVTDLAGNQSTTSGIDVFVDTTAPTAGTLAIVETNGTTGDGVVSTTTPAFTVSGSTDTGYMGAGIYSVQLQVASGTSGGSFANSGTAVTSTTGGLYALTLGTQSDGTYRVQAVVTDIA
ncbi:MAG: beta strand repeat-containing protein, partial [Chloroflexota bacterium]